MIQHTYLQLKCYQSIKFQAERNPNGTGEVEGTRCQRASHCDKDLRWCVCIVRNDRQLSIQKTLKDVLRINLRQANLKAGNPVIGMQQQSSIGEKCEHLNKAKIDVKMKCLNLVLEWHQMGSESYTGVKNNSQVTNQAKELNSDDTSLKRLQESRIEELCSEKVSAEHPSVSTSPMHLAAWI